MTALYILTKYLTFPGALVRGMWEQVVCRIAKVPVEDNRYLRRDEMISHIEHELMPSARGAFAVCFVPCLFNLVGALLFGCVPATLIVYLGFGGTAFTLSGAVAYWFAASLLVNAFPSIEDALNMAEKVYKKGSVLQKIIYAPGFAVTFIGAYLERYCLTFLLAVVGTVLLMI